MSTINYNGNPDRIRNPTAMQSNIQVTPPLRPRSMDRFRLRRRGGVWGNNENNNNNLPNMYDHSDTEYDHRNNQNTYSNRNFNPNWNINTNRNYHPNLNPSRNNSGYPRNVYYNRGNRTNNVVPSGYRNNGYGITERRPVTTKVSRDRSRSHSGQRQQRGPRPIRLNDFMPMQLRDVSPTNQNLPADFNLSNTRPETPVDALSQRTRNRTTVANDDTQPFNVNNNNDNLQRQPMTEQDRQYYQYEQQQRRATTTTTSSYRRRQRRVRQDYYRQDNRFAAFNSDNDDDAASVVDGDPMSTVNEKEFKWNTIRTQAKKKVRLYLESNRIMRYMQDNHPLTVSGRGNQAYVLASAPYYDNWVRSNYELQIWQAYLKMGSENKHWAKEVVQRTKKRDDNVCGRFVQKKIHRLSADIAQASAIISDLQIQLSTYWNHTTAGTAAATVIGSTTTSRARDSVDRIERSILKYIQHCTQHVKKMAENKIQLVKVQLEEFKALEDFEQIATPLQWNIHLTLKPKMRQWSTKNKNFRTAVKRVEYDLPPKFIEKTDLSFKVDESVIGKEEAQALYNQMRQITKEFRTQSMTLYLQTTTREHELLSNEIKRIIEGFPKETDDGFDTEPGHAAFKHYNQLRAKRMNLEAEQMVYFLDEQRVEGETEQQDLVVAPTLTRSLGEDFLLQQ